jgi:hypothetical protein
MAPDLFENRPRFIGQHLSRVIVDHFFFNHLLINPSCYLTKKLMLQARTKRATLISKPLAVTA